MLNVADKKSKLRDMKFRKKTQTKNLFKKADLF